MTSTEKANSRGPEARAGLPLESDAGLKVRYDSVIIDLVVRIMVPFIQVFALYVVAHGHYSPGGGFQGGAIMAASVLLLRLSLGQAYTSRLYPLRSMLVLAGVGVFIFAVTGIVPMVFGGNFLDYGFLPFPGDVEPSVVRGWGSLFIEIGVALGVFGILVSIFDDLMGREE
ncbi:MAG: Na(+)/H(+) antiporter subunit B [Thermoleophilia bacterium]